MAQNLPDPALFGHKREDRIRVTDIDFQRHVNNAVFAQFLASARYDFLGDHVRPHLAEGGTLVVAGTQITYLAEMTYGTAIETLSRVKQLGRSSMVMQQVIQQQDKAVALAETTMVYRLNGTSAGWPEAVRAGLEVGA